MAKKGISVSFRLHPDDDKERQAIEVIRKWEEKGYSIREIMTDALLRAAGYEPEKYRDGSHQLTPSLLESILDEFGRDLIQQIRENGGIASAGQKSERPAPFDDDEEDLAAMQNLIKGHVSRSGGKK